MSNKTNDVKAKKYADKMGWEFIGYHFDSNSYHVKCAGLTGLILPRLLILEGDKLVANDGH